MKILWLGQGGLLLVSGKTKVIIDPYLSNSLAEYNRKKFARGMKINKKIFKVKPDAIVLTNNHSDHADIATVERFIRLRKNRGSVTVLSCESVFSELINMPSISGANHVMLESGSEWTVGDIRIRAVPAKTDDKTAIGLILTDLTSGKAYYVCGDTLYNRCVLDSLPNDIFVAFVPINGQFGCMNIADATRFARETRAEFVVPVHFGMFDNINPRDLELENLIIPKIYKIIDFFGSEAMSIKKGFDRKFNEKLTAQNSPLLTVTETVADRATENVSHSKISVPKETEAERRCLEEEIIEQAKNLDFYSTFTTEVETIKDSFFADDVDTEGYTLAEAELVESIEEITEAEDTTEVEYTEEIEVVEDIPEAEDIEEIEDVDNIPEVEDIEEIEDVDNIPEVEDIEEIEDAEEIKGVDDVEDMEEAEGIVEFEDSIECDPSFENSLAPLSSTNEYERVHWEREEDDGDDLDAIIALNDPFFEDFEGEEECTEDTEVDESLLIDAYIKEIEKFERGETSEFARPK